MGDERPPRPRRRPDQHDEPDRGRRRREPRGHPHAGVAARADARRRPRRASIFAGAAGGGYVFPEFLPAYDAMASLCKLLELLAQYERAPLSEHRRRAAAPDADPPRGRMPVGAQGHGHARAERALRRRRRRPARRDQGLRRARLGAGAARTPTSRSSTSTPRASSKEVSDELESEIHDVVDRRDRAGGDRRRSSEPEPLT